MKRKMYLMAIAAGVIFISACNKTEGEKAGVKEAAEVKTAQTDAEAYTIDKAASVINWTGTKPTRQHHGTINLSQGELKVKNGLVESGNFTIDMKSIVVLDVTDIDMNKKLSGHLASADFFNVESFPAAKFEITKLENYSGEALEGFTPTHIASGNLSMLDITKEVSFPVSINVTERSVVVKSPVFVINRTLWGINYKSKSIFADLKDQFINDEMGLELNVVATK